MVAMPFVQDLIVTVMAIVAIALVLRRLFGFMRPKGASACTSCPSSKGTCAPAAAPSSLGASPVAATAPAVAPLRFLSKDGSVARFPRPLARSRQ